MARVAFDADVLIGFFDRTDAHHEDAVAEIGRWLASEHHRCLGASVYAEVMVWPIRRGHGERVDAFLRESATSIVALDSTIARRAAELRGRHRALGLGDALSLATAIAVDAQLVTFDRQLARIAAALPSPDRG